MTIISSEDWKTLGWKDCKFINFIFPCTVYQWFIRCNWFVAIGVNGSCCILFCLGIGNSWWVVLGHCSMKWNHGAKFMNSQSSWDSIMLYFLNYNFSRLSIKYFAFVEMYFKMLHCWIGEWPFLFRNVKCTSFFHGINLTSLHTLESCGSECVFPLSRFDKWGLSTFADKIR